jgi:hypothetical protein
MEYLLNLRTSQQYLPLSTRNWTSFDSCLAGTRAANTEHGRSISPPLHEMVASCRMEDAHGNVSYTNQICPSQK